MKQSLVIIGAGMVGFTKAEVEAWLEARRR